MRKGFHTALVRDFFNAHFGGKDERGRARYAKLYRKRALHVPVENFELGEKRQSAIVSSVTDRI